MNFPNLFINSPILSNSSIPQLRFLMLIYTPDPSHGLKGIQQICLHSCKNESIINAYLITAQISSICHHALASTSHRKHCYLHYMLAIEQSLAQWKQFQQIPTQTRTCYLMELILQKNTQLLHCFQIQSFIPPCTIQVLEPHSMPLHFKPSATLDR